MSDSIITFRVEPELKAALIEEAEHRCMSLSKLILYACKNEILWTDTYDDQKVREYMRLLGDDL